jgi:hypothetical protein
VRHRSHQLPRHIARQLCVGVEGNDIFDFFKNRRVPNDQGEAAPAFSNPEMSLKSVFDSSAA